MRVTGNKASGAALLAVVLVGLGVTGCGNNNANGCAVVNTPGPTPAAGSEFVFVPNASCASGAANNVMSVLVLTPGQSPPINTGPVPVVQTGSEPIWATVDPLNHFVYTTNFGDNTVSGFTLDTTTGGVVAISGSPFAAGTNPGAVVVDPSDKFVYVANDGSNNVSGYSIGATGALTALATSPFPAGTTPQQGIAATTVAGMEYVYVSNEGSGNVSAYSLNTTTGALAPIAGSPFTLAPALNPQPVSLAMDPGGRFLFTANANSNNVSAFTVNAGGSLSPVAGSPFAAGNSPQYLVTDRTGSYLYVVNVNDTTVSAYTITQTGASAGTLTPIVPPCPSSPLGVCATGFGPEGLAVDASNNFLIVADCGDGTIAGYSISGGGTLTSLGTLFLGGCPQAVATTNPVGLESPFEPLLARPSTARWGPPVQ